MLSDDRIPALPFLPRSGVHAFRSSHAFRSITSNPRLRASSRASSLAASSLHGASGPSLYVLGSALFLREVNRSLALVCILKDSVLHQQGLLEYNFKCFRQSLFELFRLPPAE